MPIRSLHECFTQQGMPSNQIKDGNKHPKTRLWLQQPLQRAQLAYMEVRNQNLPKRSVFKMERAVKPFRMSLAKATLPRNHASTGLYMPLRWLAWKPSTLKATGRRRSRPAVSLMHSRRGRSSPFKDNSTQERRQDRSQTHRQSHCRKDLPQLCSRPAANFCADASSCTSRLCKTYELDKLLANHKAPATAPLLTLSGIPFMSQSSKAHTHTHRDHSERQKKSERERDRE